MKEIKKIFLCIFAGYIAVFIVILLGILVFIAIPAFFGNPDNPDEITEYMKNYPQSDRVVYVDASNYIYFHDKTVNRSDESVNVLYVTADSVFYACSEDGYARVYEANHDITKRTLVLQYETDIFNIFMKDENKIFYTSKDENGYSCHVKYIKEDETKSITEEEFNACSHANDYYSVKVNKSRNKINGFEITSKSSGTTKYIDEDFKQEILKIEEAKKLEEYAHLSYYDYILKDEQIYIVCKSSNIITVYQYYPETEEITLTDWMDTRGVMNTENIDIYIF